MSRQKKASGGAGGAGSAGGASSMRKTIGIIVALVVVVAIVLSSALFTVPQTQQALVLQFGNPKAAITEPGLHVKIPFIQNVVFIDKRILDLDSATEEVIASDQKRLVVDAFARFRITDPLVFYKALNNLRAARSRLNTLVSSNMRSVLGKEPFVAVVRDRRDSLMRDIAGLVNAQARDFGIEIVDVRIRRADLPEANSLAIYRRMQTERQQEAAQIRAVGQENSREIRARGDKDVAFVLAAAYRDAEIIRGYGDGCRNRIFARAFGEDPEFFSFYRSMQSYQRALEDEDTMLVLSPDSEFLKFFLSPDQEGTSATKKPPRRASRTRTLKLDEGNLRDTICPDLKTGVEKVKDK